MRGGLPWKAALARDTHSDMCAFIADISSSENEDRALRPPFE